MQITFKLCPDLLRVGEIGYSIVEADDSFLRQFVKNHKKHNSLAWNHCPVCRGMSVQFAWNTQHC